MYGTPLFRTCGNLALITDEIARWRSNWRGLNVSFDSFSLSRYYSDSHQIGDIFLPNKNRIPKVVRHPHHQIRHSTLQVGPNGNAAQQSTFQIRRNPDLALSFPTTRLATAIGSYRKISMTASPNRPNARKLNQTETLRQHERDSTCYNFGSADGSSLSSTKNAMLRMSRRRRGSVVIPTKKSPPKRALLADAA